MDLDRMIPILYAHFHNANSLRKSRLGYLLDSGTKEVRLVSPVRSGNIPVPNARTLAPEIFPQAMYLASVLRA